MKRLLSLGLAGLLAGCSTPRDIRQDYTLRETHIVVDSARNINKIYENLTKTKATCYGFTCGNSIYVKADKFGEPDFHILGHEIWHRIKGEYHD